MGYLVKWEDGGTVTREVDTLACRHCQRVLLKPAHQLRDRASGRWLTGT